MYSCDVGMFHQLSGQARPAMRLVANIARSGHRPWIRRPFRQDLL